MKIENLESATKICGRIKVLESKIKFLQSKKIENKDFSLRFEGRGDNGRFDFYAELGHMEGYIVSQVIQMYQKEKAELESTLDKL